MEPCVRASTSGHNGPQRRSAENKQRSFLYRWVMANSLVAGLLALCWLILRSGTKPSRLAYPCQQAALSMASLAFGAPLVGTLLAARRRLISALRSPRGVAVGVLGLLVTASVWCYWGRAETYQGPVLEPPADYRAQVFHVPNCPQDPIRERFAGLDDLLVLMGRNGLKFYQSDTESLLSGPEGIIGADDVVVVKINYQWPERGGTNTDLLRGLLWRIVDHPDTFSGEIVIGENTQVIPTNNFNRAENNAQDISQSPRDVVTDFADDGYAVSDYVWRDLFYVQVDEYSEGDMADGYVSGPYNAEVHGRVSYPKFETDFGTYVSLRYGVWDPVGETYDRERLKFINVPLLKAHGTNYGVTGCVKHYMGVVTNTVQNNSHNGIEFGILGALMGEIQLADLNILDAIWILPHPEEGPTSTYELARRKDMLVASLDPVAADMWATTNILIPAFLDEGYSPPWPEPSADPADPNSMFRTYLDNSMYQILAAGYTVTNDLSQIDVLTWRGGDFDSNGTVDQLDYDAFVLCYTGLDGGPVDPECEAGDFDGDGDIDCDDWSRFELAWTEPGDPPAFAECFCVPTNAPQAEPEPVVAKNRYMSFVPGNAGQQAALRVTLSHLPEQFASFEGEARWVGPPSEVSESSGNPGPTPTPTLAAARLQCDPHYRDWGDVGVLHVYSHAIVPGARYTIQAIDEVCDVAIEAHYSDLLQVNSARWGDLVGDCGTPPCTPPDGRVDFIDIMAVVDKFKNEPGAPIKARADLAGNLPDLVIDFNDISYAVEAFRGNPYPFDGPGPCE